MTDHNYHVVRRAGRALALTPGVLVVLTAGPALAIPPEQWPAPEPVSTLHVLLILVVIPLALVAMISLLVYVPSIARGDKYTPGLAWRNENEWFGGPRGGVEAADNVERRAIDPGAVDPGAVDPKGVDHGTDEDRGGSSAHW